MAFNHPQFFYPAPKGRKIINQIMYSKILLPLVPINIVRGKQDFYDRFLISNFQYVPICLPLKIYIS